MAIVTPPTARQESVTITLYEPSAERPYYSYELPIAWLSDEVSDAIAFMADSSFITITDEDGYVAFFERV
jgi:hypothetical protein